MIGDISDYFRTKIEKIKPTISTRLGGAHPDPIRLDLKHTGVDFCALSPVTEEDLKKIISSADRFCFYNAGERL